MDEAFWADRWRTSRIGFHEGKANRFLERFADGCMPPRGQGRVLVPLCGKSVDLAFLAARGHAVLGCEIIEEAARAFFSEHQLAATETERAGFRLLTSGHITIAVGDALAVEPAIAGRASALYYRAALVALPPTMRESYVAALARVLEPGAPGLLITFEHDAAGGPPFDVPRAEVERVYGTRFDLEELTREDVLGENPHMLEKGATRVSETAWRLVLR